MKNREKFKNEIKSALDWRYCELVEEEDDGK